MNSVLRKLLERNNLVEKDGEWYYPPYNMRNWIVLTREDDIRFILGFNITKDNKVKPVALLKQRTFLNEDGLYTTVPVSQNHYFLSSLLNVHP